MTEHEVESRQVALKRALRVSNQSCTGYAYLRDMYNRRSLWLDLSILLLSAWLTSMVFVQPHIKIDLFPHQIPGDIWIGLLSIATFSLSLIQLQVNWKGRAQLYQQAASTLGLFIKEYRPIADTISEADAQAALAQYSVMTDGLEPIPETMFLKLKRKHLLKVEMSRLLDDRPAASLLLYRIQITMRDNKIKNRSRTSDGDLR